MLQARLTGAPALQAAPQLAVGGFALLALLGAAAVPYQLSLVAVIVLAGPHNWMELRYFLTHMPARWGPLRGWFTVALGGTALLAAANLWMLWIGTHLEDAAEFWPLATAAWTTALILWVALLVEMKRSHFWTWPAALLLIGTVWSAAIPWDLALVFLHPLIALVFVDCELRRHPAWRRAWRGFLCALPALCCVLWWGVTADPAPLADAEALDRVTTLAGAALLPSVAPQKLVALYVFLQMLHYGAWIVVLPLLRLHGAPWRLRDVPLARRWPLGVGALLCAGLTAVGALWCGFGLSLQAAWDIYFRVAIAHVVAEFPFLVRKL